MYFADMSVGLLSLNLTLASIGLLALTAFIAEEIISLNKAERQSHRVLSYLTLMALTLFSLQPLSMLVSVIFFMNNADVCCNVIITATYSMYWLGKGVYASVFLVRLYAMGKASDILAYPLSLIITLCVVQFIGTVVLCVLWSFEHVIHGHIESTESTKKCVLAKPLYLVVLTGIFEVCSSGLLLWLFIKKLEQTFRTRMGPNRQIQHIINKNTVLVTITLSCSAFLGLLSLFVLYPRDISINAVDLVINALCLSLMKRRWDGCYRRLCKYPDRCINIAFLKILEHFKVLMGVTHSQQRSSAARDANGYG